MNAITELPREAWSEIEIVGSKFSGHHKQPFVEIEGEKVRRLFVSGIEAATYYEKSKMWATYCLRKGERFTPIEPNLARDIFNHVDKIGMP
jgi:hypothetical protein